MSLLDMFVQGFMLVFSLLTAVFHVLPDEAKLIVAGVILYRLLRKIFR